MTCQAISVVAFPGVEPVDALLHAAASVLIKDLYAPFARSEPTDAAERRLIRVLVVVVGGLAYWVAMLTDLSLVYLLLLSYGAIAQLFPLLLATFFWPRATPHGAVAGLLAGCAVTVAWNLFPELQWQQIHPGLWGVAANALTLVAVSLLTRPMDEEHVARFVVR